MSQRYRLNVGKTREKLSEIITEWAQRQLGRTFYCDPKDLRSNYPMYATPQFDGVSWDGYIRDTCSQRVVSVHSYYTMRELVKRGATFRSTTAGWELCIVEDTNP